MLRILTITSIAILLISCNNKPAIENSKPELKKANQDTVINVSFKKNVKDSLIINTTHRRIDILYNGVDRFLGGQRNPKLHFETECMSCQRFQPHDKGILFGKRLYIDKNTAKIYQKNIGISDTNNIIKTMRLDGESKKKQLNFGAGKITMQYNGSSCQDTDYTKVVLTYDDGKIEINKLLGAAFFEYDLDKDGEMEQYLLGIRNCGQEIVVLRIMKPKP